MADDPSGEHLTGAAALARTRDLLAHFRVAMLLTRSADGQVSVRPLGMLGDPKAFAGQLWFFVDGRSAKVQAIRADPRASLTFQNDAASRYLHLTGEATAGRDPRLMRQFYTPVVRAWFPDGLDDPNLVLLRFEAHSGAFWDRPGGPLHLLLELTRALVTGQSGEGGQMGTLTL